MIDDSDGDFAAVVGSTGGPIFGLVMLILAVVLWYVACQNAKECSEMTCPNGAPAELVAHDCRCLDKPLPKGATSADTKGSAR